ncbi:MAG: ORF6N domain-containing protein [Bacteroidaceae bacterium]|nr:ORF6N domain-containing protein [Bacteroidaceae bacterium]
MNDLETIQKKIYEIRGQRVMLDRDLAELYGVTTGALNQAVKRNKERFPEDFMFQLTRIEFDFIKSNFQKSKSADIQKDDVLISQIVISKPIERRGGSQKLPYAFTEQGVAMLSSVLHSSLAIKVNVDIMRAFVAIRRIAASLPHSDYTNDVAQLRKDFEELKRDVEDILRDQNDINEDTRAQLDAISMALAELQAREPARKERKPIGFIRSKDN